MRRHLPPGGGLVAIRCSWLRAFGHGKSMVMAEPELTLPALHVLRIRVTLRLAAPVRLPSFKGALFCSGLGYALQRIACPQQC